jgi:chemotaxis signal transduction protein
MSSEECLVFEVGGHHFSIPLAQVEEVVPATTITRIPNSPPFLLGLAAVRGRVMVVIDCALRYGLPKTLSSYFLVCLVRGNLTAITIDRPVQAGKIAVRPLDEQEAAANRARCNVDSKFLKGTFELLELVAARALLLWKWIPIFS